MDQETPKAAITRGGDSPLTILDLPGREYQALWFALARLPWNSLVLVPADEGGSVAHVAKALAAIGEQLSLLPVTHVVAHPLDYRSVIQIAAGVASRDRGGDARQLPRGGRAIIAIEPVVVEPLGVAVCQQADATVICVELGQTGLAATRKTIELIGRDNLAGCFVIG